MSRPLAWTRVAATRCGRSSATSWPVASRSCSPRSTWRTRTSSTTQRSRLTEYRCTPPTSTMSFSLLPATLKPRKAVYDDQSFLCSARFGHHAAARCPALLAQPQDDSEWPADSNHHALAVRLLLL